MAAIFNKIYLPWRPGQFILKLFTNINSHITQHTVNISIYIHVCYGMNAAEFERFQESAESALTRE